MNLKRISAIAMLAALPVGGLTACGGEDTPAPAPTSSSTTTTATSTETPSTSTTSKTPDLPTDGPSIYGESVPPAVGDILVAKGEGGFWYWGKDSDRIAYRAFDNGQILFGDNTGVYLYDPASRQIKTIKMPDGIIPTGQSVVMQGTTATAVVAEQNPGETLDGETFKVSTVIINQDGTAARGTVLADSVDEMQKNVYIASRSETTKWFSLTLGAGTESEKFYITDGTKLVETREVGDWVGPFVVTSIEDSMFGRTMTDPTGKLKSRTYYESIGLVDQDKYFVYRDSNAEYDIYDLATGKKLYSGADETFNMRHIDVVVGNIALTVGGGSVVAFDLAKGKVVYSHEQFDVLQFLGVADETHVWIGNLQEHKLYKVDIATGNIASTTEDEVFSQGSSFKANGLTPNPTTVVQALGSTGDFQSLIALTE